MREIIQNGNGSISNFLAKLGAFPEDYVVKQALAQSAEKASNDDVKQNLENRVVAATRYNTDNAAKAAAEKATVLPGGNQEEETPNLPSSNQNLNNN